jgi:hypothetical protein
MKVLLTADAEKQFVKLPKPEHSKVEKKLKLLTQNPHAGKKFSRSIRRSALPSCVAVSDYLYLERFAQPGSRHCAGNSP